MVVVIRNRRRSRMPVLALMVVLLLMAPVVCAQMPVTIRGKVTYANETGVGKGWPVNVTNLGTDQFLGSAYTTLGSEYLIGVEPSAVNVGNTLEVVTQNGSWVGRTTYVVQTGDNIGGKTIWANISINLPPNVTVETPVGTQCGNVTINYTLMDANSDPCSIAVEFKGGGHANWTTATVSGQTTGLTSSPGGEAHSITWQSGSDAAGEDELFQVRITPSDGMVVGDTGTTAEFEVDNEAPTLVFIDPTPVNGAEVTNNYVIINVSISGDDVNAVWLVWTPISPPPGSGAGGSTEPEVTYGLPSETLSTFTMTNLSAGDYLYTVFANDTTTCANVGTTGTRTVTINLPNVTVETPVGTQCGNVTLTYTLMDANSDPCSITVEFKGSGHANWTTATISGQTTNLTSSPGGEAHSIIWQSGSDAAGEAALFQVRITPSDAMVVGDTGTTAEFEVDNEAPTLVFIDPTPVNGTTVTNNYVTINVSISGDDVNAVWLVWTPISPPPGSGAGGSTGSEVIYGLPSETFSTFTMTNLSAGDYLYTVFANDTTTCANVGTTGTRTVTINLTRTFELSLSAGTNLISIPIELEDYTLNAVFANASNGDLIYAYNNGAWAISQYYSAYSTWDGDFLSVYLDDGYEYNAMMACTATIEGSEAGPRSVPIVAGWNLIGYTRLSEAALNDLITIDDGCSNGDLIYALYNGDWSISQYYSAYSAWDGDVTGMEPGRGYWYNATTPFTWEY
jgi:hypothetical protein